MNFKIDKYIEYDNLTLKQKIVVGIITIIVLILGINIITFLSKDKGDIDYHNYSAQTFIDNAINDSTRETYWILENLAVTMLTETFYANTERSSFIDNKNPSEYYSIATIYYKDYINKNKFTEKLNNITKKFCYEENDSYNIDTRNIIDKIFVLDNRYMCKLITQNDEYVYIGFEIDLNKHMYKIFYLE